MTRQSCCHARIVKGNPVATPGLTAGRVSGEKTLCQRYCEDSIADRPSVLARGLAGCRLCRAAGASQPFAKKKRAAVLPPREDWNFCDIGATNVKETRLGEPVLGEPVLGRAIKRGWGEPSNEVGASHQTRLGEPVLRGWASQYLGEPVLGRASTKGLGKPLNHSGLHACFKAAPWRSYGASSARARSAHLVPARHI